MVWRLPGIGRRTRGPAGLSFPPVSEPGLKLGNLVARRDLLQQLMASEVRTSTTGPGLGWTRWQPDPLLMMLLEPSIVIIFPSSGFPRDIRPRCP